LPDAGRTEKNGLKSALVQNMSCGGAVALSGATGRNFREPLRS
jgi:hypothetical protein